MSPRGIHELRYLRGMEQISARGEEFAMAMHDIHQQVKETVQKSVEKYKKFDLNKRDV
jgi:Lon protease-like protein